MPRRHATETHLWEGCHGSQSSSQSPSDQTRRPVPQPSSAHECLGARELAKHGVAFNKRARIVERSQCLPFMPPEDWHEPHETGGNFKIIVQPPGEGFRHVLTPGDVRQRLSLLPEHFTRNLEVVQFSRMTRKKASFPATGMQWGAAIYLYPIEQNWTEDYDNPPKPNQVNEARMYGGVWTEQPDGWQLIWTEETIRDFYLNNILIHELGHLVDDRNTSYQVARAVRRMVRCGIRL